MKMKNAVKLALFALMVIVPLCLYGCGDELNDLEKSLGISSGDNEEEVAEEEVAVTQESATGTEGYWESGEYATRTERFDLVYMSVNVDDRDDFSGVFDRYECPSSAGNMSASLCYRDAAYGSAVTGHLDFENSVGIIRIAGTDQLFEVLFHDDENLEIRITSQGDYLGNRAVMMRIE